MAYAIRHQRPAARLSGLDVLAGIWLLVSPFMMGFQNYISAVGNNVNGAITNNVVFGIVITLLALWRALNPAISVWISWLNVLLGIWVLISPWVVGFNGMRSAMTNNLIMGIVVIILAGWSALVSTAPSEEATTGGPSM